MESYLNSALMALMNARPGSLGPIAGTETWDALVREYRGSRLKVSFGLRTWDLIREVM